jgi:hypothetical protein
MAPAVNMYLMEFSSCSQFQISVGSLRGTMGYFSQQRLGYGHGPEE